MLEWSKKLLSYTRRFAHSVDNFAVINYKGGQIENSKCYKEIMYRVWTNNIKKL